MCGVTSDTTERSSHWIKVADDTTPIRGCHGYLVGHVQGRLYFWINRVRPYLTITVNKHFVTIEDTRSCIRVVLVNLKPLLNCVSLFVVLVLSIHILFELVRQPERSVINTNLGRAAPIHRERKLAAAECAARPRYVLIYFEWVSGTPHRHITGGLLAPTELKIVVPHANIWSTRSKIY